MLKLKLQSKRTNMCNVQIKWSLNSYCNSDEKVFAKCRIMYKKQNAATRGENYSYIPYNHVANDSWIKSPGVRDKISNKNIKEIIGNLIKDIIKELKKNPRNNRTPQQDAVQTVCLNNNNCVINPKNWIEDNKLMWSCSIADTQYSHNEGQYEKYRCLTSRIIEYGYWHL